MAFNSDEPRIDGMLVLLMTSSCSHEKPAIVGQQAMCIANLHAGKIGQGHERVELRGNRP